MKQDQRPNYLLDVFIFYLTQHDVNLFTFFYHPHILPRLRLSMMFFTRLMEDLFVKYAFLSRGQRVKRGF